MKFAFECVVLLVVVAAFLVIDGSSVDDIAWTNYKLTYGKNYNILFDGGSLDAKHKEVFLATLANIEQHNSDSSSSYRQELNRFSDLFTTELQKFLGLSVALAPSARRFNESTREIGRESRQLPDSFDYRSDACMPPIKDQGECGSCWAFAAIAPLEFSHCKTHQETLVVLSEQQLVDCDRVNSGCDGGWYTDAWDYIRRAGGVATQSSYPYTASQSLICKFWQYKLSIGARVSSFDYITSNDPVAMQTAVQNFGPIAVAFAVTSSFYSYASGVYDDPACDGQTINHAVVVVGWGNLNGIDYWIVRNSWGTDWGLSGYFLIQRGVNKCGIETYPAYVVAATRVYLWQFLFL